MASSLVRSIPDRGLARDLMLCSGAGHYAITVPLGIGKLCAGGKAVMD